MCFCQYLKKFGINDFVTLQVYLLATTTESAVWVSLRTAWQCVPDLGTASSRSGIEIETTRSNSKNPSYKITIILTTTKPQSKLLKALEDKETERQEQKNGFVPIFFKFCFWPYLGFAFQCSRSVMMSANSKKAKKLDLLS